MKSHLSDEQAQALVDRALPDDERARCHEHLASCPDCELLVESYRALSAALDDLDAPAPPPGFTAEVMACIALADRRRAWDRRLALGILGVATCLAAALLALAGGPGWARTLAGAADALAHLGTAVSVAVGVASPLLQALRLQIAVACAAVALPLLFALSRLVPRGAAAAA